MIKYDPNRISHMLRASGSVLPKSIWWSLPSSLLAITVKIYLWLTRGSIHYAWDAPGDTARMTWSLVLSSVVLLVVFRANMAYSRFWEAFTLVEQTRGRWINAFISMIAFRNKDNERRVEVHRFQHLLARLMSMMFATSLADVADDPMCKLNVLDLTGMDVESLQYLDSQNTKHEIILQWIQSLIVDGEQSGVLKISPPILARVFQELSAGMALMNDARKFTIIPFPYPLAQVTFALIAFVAYIAVPFACGWYLSFGRCAGYSILGPIIFWALYHVAIELEVPFGHQQNKLPVSSFQIDLNTSLLALLREQSQNAPLFWLPDEALEEEIPEQTVKTHRVSESSKANLLSSTTSFSLSASEHHSTSRRVFEMNVLAAFRKKSSLMDDSGLSDDSVHTTLAAMSSVTREEAIRLNYDVISTRTSPSSILAANRGESSSQSPPGAPWGKHQDAIEPEVHGPQPEIAPHFWSSSNDSLGAVFPPDTLVSQHSRRFYPVADPSTLEVKEDPDAYNHRASL